MENNLHDIEWIERYLDRSMRPEEKREMEKRLMEEPDLKSKYLAYRELVQGMRYSHLQNKLEQLKALENSLPAIEAAEKSGGQIWLATYWKPVAIAASLILVVFAYSILMMPLNPQKVYAKYFEPYPNVFEPTVRGNNTRDDQRTDAFQAYDRGNYEKAAALFNILLKEKQEPGMLLLLGNANLMLGKTAEAQNNFLTLIKNFEELDAQARWFLGLSYLKQGETEKARLIFQELENPEVTYSKKANDLLKEVR